MPRMEPAERTLCYVLADGVNYIDIAKDLSVVNRRLYRQGKVYAIQNVQVFFEGADSGATDTSQEVRLLTVSTIPNTWVAHNAWVKGFKVWSKQQREGAKLLGGSRARPTWADFKIGMDAVHIAIDSGSGDQDISLDTRARDFSTTLVPDEWKISEFIWEDDNGQDRSPLIHMMGQVANDQLSYAGLIENYGDTRPQIRSSDPLIPADASDADTSAGSSVYTLMYGSEDVSTALIGNIEDKNDQPPYDSDAYPGGASVMTTPQPQVTAAANATNPVGNTGPFVAPCGLLHVDLEAWWDADPGSPGTDLTNIVRANTRILVTVAPGPYRGVLAANMGQ